MARIRTTRQARELRVLANRRLSDKRWIETSSRLVEQHRQELAQIREWGRQTRQLEVKKKFRHRRPRVF